MDQPPQNSVAKPVAVPQTSVEVKIARLEAMMQQFATELAELKNTSSVSKPATTELDQSVTTSGDEQVTFMDPLPRTSVEKPGDVLPLLPLPLENEAANSVVKPVDTSVDEERASSATKLLYPAVLLTGSSFSQSATMFARLEATMQQVSTELAELKNTSSVSKPATTEPRVDQSVNTSGDEQVSFYGLLPTTSVEKLGDVLLPPPLPLPRGDTLATASSGQPYPPPPPPPKATTTAAPPLIRLAGRKEIQQAIFHPLRAAVTGEFPDWQLPTFLTTEDGARIELDELRNTFEINWRTVGRFKSAVLENLQVLSWTVRFYEEEPDPTPDEWPDRPRLDAVLTLSNGKWARWHPSGDPILSTEPMPTKAMTIRINRKKKLMLQLQKSQAQR